MDTPFDMSKWQATSPTNIDQRLTANEISSLSQTLCDQTREIAKHPYDPDSWIQRANTLQHLQYPELALADAWRAQQLCDAALYRLNNSTWSWTLGYAMGFWMAVGEDCDGEESDEGQQSDDKDSDEQDRRCTSAMASQTLQRRREEANTIVDEQLTSAPISPAIGFNFRRRPYPWMEPRHAKRDDAMLEVINAELKSNSANDHSPDTAFCEVRRHAFGKCSKGESDSSETLGIFALRNIPKNTTILHDKTTVFGCNGPGVQGDLTNLGGITACGHPLHPNIPSDYSTHDLRWIRDELGSESAETILLCRLLLRAIMAERHPLDLSIAARLTPCYRAIHIWRGDIDVDLAVPMRALQRFGVDIYTSPDFEPWVLFTLAARLSNNRASTPVSTTVFPLFSLFNHSCRPNVMWAFEGGGHCVLNLETLADVRAGEQLFICYDRFTEEMALEGRRAALSAWLDGDCQCVRCEEEERSEKRKRKGRGKSWDDETRTVLPEDEVRVTRKTRNDGTRA